MSQLRSLAYLAGRSLVQGVKLAAAFGGFYAVIMLVSIPLHALLDRLHLNEQPWPVSYLGWLALGGALVLIVAHILSPTRTRQSNCMHHDPRYQSPIDGAPTISWVARAEQQPASGKYRKFWCSRCQRVWLFPVRRRS